MHKATITAALAAASLLALSACKQQAASNEAGTTAAASADAINGSWKTDVASVTVEQQPDHLLLQNGQYSCDTCVPKMSIPADGAYHPVSGSGYFDSSSVKVVDDHTVSYSRKKGDKIVGEFSRQVSADGKKMTVKFKDSSTPNAPPVSGQYTETRVGDAPAGAHAISGLWQPDKIENLSDEAAVTTYKLEGDVLHMTTPGGLSFDAKLDGTDTPIKGDPANTMASVKRAGDGFEETDKRDGKVVGVGTFGVGSDGKLHFTYVDKERNQTTKGVATKE